MNDRDRFRLRPDDLSWREIEGEVIVLDLRASAYLSLNATGGILWKRLEAGASFGELVNELAGAFGLDSVRAAADARAFLDDCRSQGLIIAAEADAPQAPPER